jgi:hypothetical protein
MYVWEASVAWQKSVEKISKYTKRKTSRVRNPALATLIKIMGEGRATFIKNMGEEGQCLYFCIISGEYIHKGR